MFIDLMFKTPDVLDQLNSIENEEERENLRKVCDKYIKWGEIIKVRISDNRPPEVLEV